MTADFHLPGSSFLHRTDPRARLLALLGLSACFLVPAEPLPLACLATACLAVVGFALGCRQLAGLLKALAPALLFIALLTPPFVRGGTALVTLAGFPLVTTAGVRAAIVFLSRLSGIAAVFFALLRTLRLEELVLALRWFGVPFPAALAVTVTFRYIPFLAGTWHEVKDAHRLRGARTGPGPVLTAVMVKAVKTIPALAMALESRGFGRAGPRSSLVALGPAGRFALHAVAVAGVCASILLLLLLPAVRRIFALPGL
ncbi:MAG: energy-coupling factor transporter transmembrane component T [Spirochaetes bacterium]|nr:energy-coupling factor transporter transmembrane component T [Spirochaetota bacterium]